MFIAVLELSTPQYFKRFCSNFSAWLLQSNVTTTATTTKATTTTPKQQQHFCIHGDKNTKEENSHIIAVDC